MERKATYSCIECSKVFSHKGTLNRHISSIHKKMFTMCKKCGEKFNRKFSLKRHMENCGQNYQCDVCDKNYETTGKLKIHKLSHHKDKFACTQCNTLFKYENSFKKHQVNCNIQCDICFTSFSKKSNLKSHKMNIHRAVFM